MLLPITMHLTIKNVCDILWMTKDSNSKLIFVVVLKCCTKVITQQSVSVLPREIAAKIQCNQVLRGEKNKVIATEHKTNLKVNT